MELFHPTNFDGTSEYARINNGYYFEWKIPNYILNPISNLPIEYIRYRMYRMSDILYNYNLFKIIFPIKDVFKHIFYIWIYLRTPDCKRCENIPISAPIRRKVCFHEELFHYLATEPTKPNEKGVLSSLQNTYVVRGNRII
jgi:hypothetical protein